MIQNFILGCLLGGVRLCLLEAEDDSQMRIDAIEAEAKLNLALGFEGWEGFANIQYRAEDFDF